jgi:hypothetical protein
MAVPMEFQPGAKVRANTDRSEASSGVVRQLSSQVSAMLGDGERRLAWFGVCLLSSRPQVRVLLGAQTST